MLFSIYKLDLPFSLSAWPQSYKIKMPKIKLLLTKVQQTFDVSKIPTQQAYLLDFHITLT